MFYKKDGQYIKSSVILDDEDLIEIDEEEYNSFLSSVIAVKNNNITQSIANKSAVKEDKVNSLLTLYNNGDIKQFIELLVS